MILNHSVFQVVLAGIDVGISEEALLGVILAAAAPFVGMWLFVKISHFLPDKTETIGPHIVVRIRKQSRLGFHTYYQCKYCGKEFERKFFFQDEDCEEFESGQ